MICNFVTNILILHCNSVAHRKVSRIVEEENTKVLEALAVRDSHRHRVFLEVLVALLAPELLGNQEDRAFLALLFLQLVL